MLKDVPAVCVPIAPPAAASTRKLFNTGRGLSARTMPPKPTGTAVFQLTDAFPVAPAVVLANSENVMTPPVPVADST